MTKMHSTRRLRIPVRFVDGVWECALGGAVPVRNDTEAELVVQRASISDKTFLQAMERKGRHKVLDEGTPLLVCLTMKQENPPSNALKPLLKYHNCFQGAIATTYLDYCNPDTLAFIEVKLAGPDNNQTRLFDTNRGGLWLSVRLKTSGISGISCVQRR
jgi:hypothetical protein